MVTLIHAAVEVQDDMAGFDPAGGDLGGRDAAPARLRSRSHRRAAAAPRPAPRAAAAARGRQRRRGRLPAARSRQGSLAARCSPRISLRPGLAGQRSQTDSPMSAEMVCGRGHCQPGRQAGEQAPPYSLTVTARIVFSLLCWLDTLEATQGRSGRSRPGPGRPAEPVSLVSLAGPPCRPGGMPRGAGGLAAAAPPTLVIQRSRLIP